jgi:hypothetical protein
MESNELQKQLFLYLKEQLPPHLSLADALCDLLHLSADSAYRRIRGEKPITLNELKRICEHYHLSVDQFLQLQNESVLFQAPGLNGKPVSFIEYMKGMYSQFLFFNSFQKTEMQYLCKDVPFWYFFLFPDMASFKTFFWCKTINNDPQLAHRQFSIDESPYEEPYAIGQQILNEYAKIPSIELWNLESIHSTIAQIAYYKEAGLFKTQEDFERVVAAFHQMIDHLHRQAEKGVKFLPGASELTHRAPLQLYFNELILGNNTILLQLDQQRISMITYSVLSYLISRDERFANKTFSSFHSFLQRSTLISNTGEKERSKFFNTLKQRIHTLKN